jgi:hypothetical protein
VATYIWGVDSAQNVTDELYDCVVKNYGNPTFWGRYLTTIPNASEGLTTEEIAFIRGKGVKVLPIYNAFRESKGYREGRVSANNAIYQARRFGFPKGTVLFANVEKFFEVDDEWIQGWIEAIYPSGYKSGIYHDPVTGNFNQAFCRAASENEQVKTQTILWSAEPETGGTGPRKAPRYAPKKPARGGNVWLWQYGRNVKKCPIDTNLADNRLLASLW